MSLTIRGKSDNLTKTDLIKAASVARTIEKYIEFIKLFERFRRIPAGPLDSLEHWYQLLSNTDEVGFIMKTTCLSTILNAEVAENKGKYTYFTSSIIPLRISQSLYTSIATVQGIFYNMEITVVFNEPVLSVFTFTTNTLETFLEKEIQLEKLDDKRYKLKVPIAGCLSNVSDCQIKLCFQTENLYFPFIIGVAVTYEIAIVIDKETSNIVNTAVNRVSLISLSGDASIKLVDEKDAKLEVIKHKDLPDFTKIHRMKIFNLHKRKTDIYLAVMSYMKRKRILDQNLNKIRSKLLNLPTIPDTYQIEYDIFRTLDTHKMEDTYKRFISTTPYKLTTKRIYEFYKLYKNTKEIPCYFNVSWNYVETYMFLAEKLGQIEPDEFPDKHALRNLRKQYNSFSTMIWLHNHTKCNLLDHYILAAIDMLNPITEIEQHEKCTTLSYLMESGRFENENGLFAEEKVLLDTHSIILCGREINSNSIIKSIVENLETPRRLRYRRRDQIALQELISFLFEKCDYKTCDMWLHMPFEQRLYLKSLYNKSHKYSFRERYDEKNNVTIIETGNNSETIRTIFGTTSFIETSREQTAKIRPYFLALCRKINNFDLPDCDKSLIKQRLNTHFNIIVTTWDSHRTTQHIFSMLMAQIKAKTYLQPTILIKAPIEDFKREIKESHYVQFAQSDPAIMVSDEISENIALKRQPYYYQRDRYTSNIVGEILEDNSEDEDLEDDDGMPEPLIESVF